MTILSKSERENHGLSINSSKHSRTLPSWFSFNHVVADVVVVVAAVVFVVPLSLSVSLSVFPSPSLSLSLLPFRSLSYVPLVFPLVFVSLSITFC